MPIARWRRGLLRWSLKSSSVIAVNSAIARIVTPSSGIRSQRLVLASIPDRVRCRPSRDVLPLRRVGRELVFVGRLRRQKGLDEALRIYHAVASRLPNTKLAVAGDVEDASVEQELMAAIKSSQGRIRYLGNLDKHNLDRLYNGAAAVLCTSRPWSEGFPLVALEAFMHGLPLVSTPQHDMDVWLKGTGIMHSGVGEEAVNRSANALASILKDQTSYSEFSFNARRRYEDSFDYKHYFDALCHAFT